MTKTEFKKAISRLKKEQLIQLLLDTYSGSKEAQRLLTGKIGVSEQDIERLTDAAEEKIWRAFHPSRGYYAKSCVAKSTKAITEFKQVCTDPKAIANLMVYQVEQIAECDFEWQIYASSFDNRTAMCARYLAKHQLVAVFEDRMNDALSHIGRYSYVSAAKTIDDYLQDIS